MKLALDSLTTFVGHRIIAARSSEEDGLPPNSLILYFPYRLLSLTLPPNKGYFSGRPFSAIRAEKFLHYKLEFLPKVEGRTSNQGQLTIITRFGASVWSWVLDATHTPENMIMPTEHKIAYAKYEAMLAEALGLKPEKEEDEQG